MAPPAEWENDSTARRTLVAMGALADLGLNTADGAIMCVSAPDSVLAEAGAMSPRPSFASTLLTAEPTARLLWWPERQYLEPQTMNRLRWLLENSKGQAWLIVDTKDDDAPGIAEVAAALREAGLGAGPSIELGGQECAVPALLRDSSFGS